MLWCDPYGGATGAVVGSAGAGRAPGTNDFSLEHNNLYCI